MFDWLSHPLLVIAGFGAVALVAGHLSRRVVPEIVVFLGVGVAIGPEGLGVINDGNVRSLDLLTEVALGAIIFLIGDRLRLSALRGMRRTLLPMTAGQIVLTMALVFVATRWAGAHFRLSALLALIAAETGVLTVTATVASLRADGRVTDHLLSGVALTNVVVAALFGLTFPLVLAVSAPEESTAQVLRVFVGMGVGSVLIGLVGGIVLRRVAAVVEGAGEELLVVMLVVTTVVGVSLAMRGSVVVSCLVAGLYLANRAPLVAQRLFNSVRVLQSPIYLVFFVVAGASVHLDDLSRFGLVGVAYLVARTVGKVGGAALGAAFAGQGMAGIRAGAWSGAALLPHAGMAIALVATVAEHTYSLGEDVSGVVLGSIVLFELAAPVLVRTSLRHAGEEGKGGGTRRAGVVVDLDASRTFERILLPVGGPEALLPRLPFILDMASGLDAELVAVHVAASAEQAPAGEAVLEVVRRAAEERGVSCRVACIVADRVSEALGQAVEDHDADLVIMGQPVRGASMLDWRRMSGLSSRTLRQVEVPVLFYPVDPSDPSERGVTNSRNRQ